MERYSISMKRNIAIVSKFSEKQRLNQLTIKLKSNDYNVFRVDNKNSIIAEFKVIRNCKYVLFFNPVPQRYFLYFMISVALRKVRIYDFYYSPYLDMVSSKKGYLRIIIRKIMEKHILLRSHLTFFLTESEKKLYSTTHNIDLNSKDYVLYPLIKDEYNFSTLLPYHSGLNNTFRIGWWGRKNNVHGLDLLIKAVEKVSELYVIELLFFVPSLEDKNLILKTIKNLYNLTFVVGRFSKDNSELKFIAENIDLAVGHFGNQIHSKNLITNKMIDAISIGLPVITGSSQAYEYFDFIHRKNVFIVEPKVDEIAECIIDVIKQDYIDMREISTAAKKVWQENFSPNSASSYLDLLVEKLNNY